MTKSVRYTDDKVESMYKRISELENEHKRFRRKIAELELGPHVRVITRTIPVEKSIETYEKKTTPDHSGTLMFFSFALRLFSSSSRLLEQTLDDFFASKPTIPLLKKSECQPNVLILSSFGSTNDQPLEFRPSLVQYSDSDDWAMFVLIFRWV